MEVKAIKCPNCGAPLEDIDNTMEAGVLIARCDYCRTVSSIYWHNTDNGIDILESHNDKDFWGEAVSGLLKGDYYDEQ